MQIYVQMHVPVPTPPALAMASCIQQAYPCAVRVSSHGKPAASSACSTSSGSGDGSASSVTRVA